jgi:hypothetical protein
VGLERGPLSLVNITEEPLERKISDSGIEDLDYGRTDRRADHVTSRYPQKLAVTSSKSSCSSVSVVRSRTKATELLLSILSYCNTLSKCRSRQTFNALSH